MKLAAVFCDHAVLQRGIAIPVWGWTRPHLQVNATLGTVAAETRAGADGRFLLRLPALAAGGPHELTVAAAGNSVTVKDLWIGEVWIASGQSNMEWPLSLCGEQGEAAVAAATQPQIRMITLPRLALSGRQSDVEAKWQVASPETAGSFSAVAYHFAKKLHDTLHVPVGILNASWGGTLVEPWTSREALMKNPDTRAWTERYEATLYSPEFWSADNANSFSFPPDPGNEGESRGWARRDCPDHEWATMDLPRIWQMAGHTYSGVFWFRLTVELPAAWAGQELLLKIGAVDKHDQTYFNGQPVGATGQGFEEQHWNLPRSYTVPAKVVTAGQNVIAVRAYSFAYGGGMIGPASQMSLSRADGHGSAISLAGFWRYREERNFGLIQAPTPPMGPGNPNSPYILFDNLIHPLIPYAIGGAIWYQGESNADNAGQYRGMLTTMIRDWRRAWGQGDFPFLQVQLANFQPASPYQEGSTWARLREAQLLACVAEPATGIAVTIDIGDEIDIHPHNKQDVGHRLAQWALVKTFGHPGTASGPLYGGMSIEGRAIRLRFDNVGSGLAARGTRLTHFVMAGLDRRFFPATARIDGATLLVESGEVPAPVAVRYAWADNPAGCNLFNQDGFPASPFRTDSWT